MLTQAQMVMAGKTCVFSAGTIAIIKVIIDLIFYIYEKKRKLKVPRQK